MLRFSTGLVQSLAKDKSLKEVMHDGVLRVYSGNQPSSADDAKDGTLLLEVTLAGAGFTPGVKSTRQIDKDVIGSNTQDQTFILTINGTDIYTYVAGAAESTTTIATALAALVDESDVVTAVSDGADVIVRARFAGVAYSIAKSGTGTHTLSNLVANNRIAGLQFGSALAGVLSKESGVWSGLVLESGNAGWWRLYGNAVDPGTSSSTTLPRIDGSCSTVSGEMLMSSINLVKDITITVDQFNVTIPKVRT